MAAPHVQHVPHTGVTDIRHSKKKQKGVLYVGKHAVLKPVNNCLSGRREVDFYNTVFQHHRLDDSHNDDVVTLQRFLPRFLGVEERAGISHIKLENIMACFTKPCMIDIKMGHVTSDPLAKPEKVVQRKNKYPYAQKLGFALSGFSVYNPETGDFEKTDKYTCHNFTLQQVIVDGLGKYFGFPNHPRCDVILCLLNKLEAIRQWFLSQRQFVFYASSLLIVYEGLEHRQTTSQSTGASGRSDNSRPHKHKQVPRTKNSQKQFTSDVSISPLCDNSLDSMASCSLEDAGSQSSVQEPTKHLLSVSDKIVDDVSEKNNSLVDVRLIDFTHAFRTKDRDDNYLSGLETLISILKLMHSWISSDIGDSKQ